MTTLVNNNEDKKVHELCSLLAKSQGYNGNKETAVVDSPVTRRVEVERNEEEKKTSQNR